MARPEAVITAIPAQARLVAAVPQRRKPQRQAKMRKEYSKTDTKSRRADPVSLRDQRDGHHGPGGLEQGQP